MSNEEKPLIRSKSKISSTNKSRGLLYCHMCGKILSHDDLYQITTKSIPDGHTSKLFDVCNDCSDKVTNMEFPLKKLSSSKRKNPQFTSIIIKKFKPRKTKLIYDVMPYQLDIIKDLEVNVENLKLVYKDGTRRYTEEQLKSWVFANRKNLIDSMYMLYQYQTEDEKKNRETKYSNNVGFNKPDANFMTGMCRIYEASQDYDRYTEKQIQGIEKCMKKYINQLLFYVNTQGKILPGA